MDRLTGKTAIVTGAASGIGRAVAAAFLRHGANVVALDIDSSVPESSDVPLAHDALLRLRVDVSQRDDVRAAVDRAEDRFGSIDVLCTCAAIDSPAPLLSITDEEWHRTMDTNALAVLSAVQCTAPAMRQAGGGSVITWGSVAAFRAEAELASYCASKAAVVMLTKSIAIELAQDNIRANCVCPGMVDTALAARHLPQSTAERAEFLDELRSWQPLGLGSPDQLADIAVFLASDESSFMTGAAVMADGGFTAM